MSTSYSIIKRGEDMEPYFILALFQHGYKARTSTLYHLLKGKRTTSVLLYGFIYENLRFFQLLPSLSEKEFNQIIDKLIQQKLVQKVTESEIQLTTKGQVVSINHRRFAQIDSYHFGKTDEAVWRLLQFTVQVVSNLAYETNNYVPLEQSPLYQKQVKVHIKSMSKAQLIQTVKNEWTELFTCLPKEEANFFAQQFSGYQRIGKTSFQLMGHQEQDFERFLLRKNQLHHLLQFIRRMSNTSLLKRIVMPLLRQNDNKSMNETKRYISENLSPDKIAQRRKVKVSTVKDHLLEAAMMEDFPFDHYLSSQTSEFLSAYPRPYQEWEYRTIKQSQPELDYFEFRLYQIQKLKEEREQGR